jgi:hypothetical protein
MVFILRYSNSIEQWEVPEASYFTPSSIDRESTASQQLIGVRVSALDDQWPFQIERYADSGMLCFTRRAFVDVIEPQAVFMLVVRSE